MVDGKLVINEKEAVIVRRIFELYLQGNSFRTICHILENEGYTPMHGGRWSKSTITGMLRNEKYCGDSIMQKSYSTMKVQKYNYGELPKYYVQDNHEPIVSREDYQKAQEMMVARSNKYRPMGSPTALYPLSGKLICGECGTSFKRKTSAHGTPYMCIKWSCRKKDVYGVKECASHDIKDEVVTRLLIEAYNESLDANNDVNGITEQEEVLRKLIANEQELRQLRAKGYISESKCREETDKILIKIKEQETLIKNLQTRDMVKGKYKKSDKLTEQMAEFRIHTSDRWFWLFFCIQTLYLTFDRIFRSTFLFAFLLLPAWLHQVPIYAIDIVKVHLAVPYDYVLKNRIDFIHGSYDLYIVTVLIASECDSVPSLNFRQFIRYFAIQFFRVFSTLYLAKVVFLFRKSFSQSV